MMDVEKAVELYGDGFHNLNKTKQVPLRYTNIATDSIS